MFRYASAIVGLAGILAIPAMAKPQPEKFILFFDHNSAEVPAMAAPVIEAAAVGSTRDKDKRVILYGFTGVQAKERSNPRLQSERFSAVQAALEARGVARTQIMRAALNDNAGNFGDVALRRIEIRVVPGVRDAGT